MAAFSAIGATREGIVEAPREDHAALLVENAVHLALSSEKRLSGERCLLTGVRGETVWKIAEKSLKWRFFDGRQEAADRAAIRPLLRVFGTRVRRSFPIFQTVSEG